MATADEWSDALLGQNPSRKKISFPSVIESGNTFIGQWAKAKKTDNANETDKANNNSKGKKKTSRKDYEEPGIKPRVTFKEQPGHLSYIEISFTIRFSEKPGDADVSSVRAGIRLTRQNVKSLKVEHVVADTASQRLHQSDPDLAANISNGLVWVLEVDFLPTPRHAFHLFTLHNYGTESDSVRDIQALFSREGTIKIYTRGLEVNRSVNQILEVFHQEALENPLAKWYPSHPAKMFIQAGEYIAAEDRPQYTIPASPCFFSFAEYTTVLGFGLINQHEYTLACEENLPEHTMNLKLMTIPGASDRRYLGFLECPDDIKLRIRPGDRLAINFNPEIDDRAEDWSATAVDPLPIASLRDVSILLTRPWEIGRASCRERV